MYYIMRKNFKATFNWTLVIISTNEKDTSILVSVSCLDADRHRLGMWLMAGNILSQEGKKMMELLHYFFLYLIHKPRDKYWLQELFICFHRLKVSVLHSLFTSDFTANVELDAVVFRVVPGGQGLVVPVDGDPVQKVFLGGRGALHLVLVDLIKICR